MRLRRWPPGVIKLSYEEAIVLRNLVHDYNAETERQDRTTVRLESKLESVMEHAPLST